MVNPATANTLKYFIVFILRLIVKISLRRSHGRDHDRDAHLPNDACGAPGTQPSSST